MLMLLDAKAKVPISSFFNTESESPEDAPGAVTTYTLLAHRFADVF